MLEHNKVGGSNTHLTTKFDIKSNTKSRFNSEVKILDKSFCIDWISYTFDNVMYDEDFNTSTFKKEYSLSNSVTNDYILNTLLMKFKIDKPWQMMEIEDYALNGYRFSWLIGENIKINFCGPNSGRGIPTTQILLSGSACREFEKYYGGNYFGLFDFLTKNHDQLNYRKFNGHFKRVDYALDDYTGKEFDIYDYKEYAENFHWSGSYRTVDIRYGAKKTGDITTTGYSATFGSKDSNQYQQYDKKLEQESKNKMFVASDVWYRHELRFVPPKSDKTVQLYMQNYISRTLNKFVYQLLKSSIDFKIKSNNKTNKSLVETLPAWNNLCNHVEKINLKQELPSDDSFEKKEKWFEKNLQTTLTQLALLHGDKLADYIQSLAENGTMKISEKQITQIKRYIESKGNIKLSDSLLRKMEMKGLRLQFDEIVNGRKNDKDKK